jgi:hypothetical protein
MPLTKLEFRPGVNRETTSYANEGGWFDCDKVRFRFGTPEKIGGWQKLSIISFLGTARSIHSFAALDGERYRALGTNLKYFLESGGSYADITPLRVTTSAGDVTFAATNGSSTITATDADHGAIKGDFVTFSGAASLGGTITANVLNQEYQIDTVVNSNSYTFTARTASTTIPDITVAGELSPTAVEANGSDTGNGGGSIVGAYQVNIGLNTTVLGTGWGAGTWGRDTWGSAASLAVAGNSIRIWEHDNFGEDLLFNARDAGIFYWDESGGTSARAVALKDLAGADTETPTIAKQVLVSDNDKHILVFGCDAETSIGTQDPLLIRFSSSASLTTWKSEVTNSAGDLRIGSGTKIVKAVETKQQIVVITDVGVHALQFIGPPFTFGIQQVGENTTIAGPLSVTSVDDNVFWMGQGDFYVYTGQTQKLPCSVKSYVFNDFNEQQREKVVAGSNSAFSEIWWFYPSADSDENDRYVVYNYLEKTWYYGSLSRTAWIDKGIDDDPTAASGGFLYLHEVGNDDGSTNPVSSITSYVESSQIDIGDGDKFVFMRRILPDLTFVGSTSDAPSANFTMKARNFPGGNYLQTDENSVTRSATSPVEQFTDQLFVRLRGRSFAVRVESTAQGTQWRFGAPRVDIRPDGRQ